MPQSREIDTAAHLELVPDAVDERLACLSSLTVNDLVGYLVSLDDIEGKAQDLALLVLEAREQALKLTQLREQRAGLVQRLRG
jgi:beta-xylosidase